MDNYNKEINSPESSFKRSMWLVCWITLILPPLTGIFMLSFVGVFPFPEVLYPFTDYALIVVILATIVAIIITKNFIKFITDIVKSNKKIKADHKHLKRLALYYFSILFLYFGLGLVCTLYSLSTLYDYNYPLSKYFFSFLGIIPGGLITALPIFFYLSDSLGRYIAPSGIHILVAPIKLKLIVLGLFIPVLIDTLLIMYFYDRTGYLSYETIGIWLFLIVIAGIGTTMAWKSFKQSMSPFVTALELEDDTHSAVSIIPQSLDELGLLSQRWNSLWLRVSEYENQLSDMNLSLRNNVNQRSQELESERQLNIKIQENATALIIVLDNKGRILRFNPASEQLTGFLLSELKNKFIWDYLIPPEQLDAVKEVFKNLSVSRINSQYESELIKKDGGRVLITWNNSTVADETGEVEYVIYIGIDISEREASQKVLEEAIDAANKANHAKSEFLSSMSHELRTPLNAILGFSQIIEMNTKEEKTRGGSQEVINAGNHLLSLVNEILDLSKIESGNIELSIEKCCLNEILNSMLTLINPLAEKHSIEIEHKVSTSFNINVDKMRFRQILLNILSNAIKYNSENGKVIIDSSTDNNMLCLSIADTGKGLTPEQQISIFQPFNRAGKENSNIEGAGLGLNISKDLIELMGGTITVKSTIGNGSSFLIHVPLS